jgi:tetratricopeptide (TPR) repeat protein
LCQNAHMTPAKRPLSPAEELKELLGAADYDTALRQVGSWDLRSSLDNTHGLTARLQFRCMVADVWDYGGEYPNAALVIREEGRAAQARLSDIKSPAEIGDDHAFVKQSCWALMMWGMCFYRGLDNNPPDYENAKRLFLIAKNVLEQLRATGRLSCFGSLARVWYCLGLVERQDHDYRAAREAFRHSIEVAGRGIEQNRSEAVPPAFDYHIGRCYGLGLGWISYNAARLNDGASALVIARRLMMWKRAKFISAYVDVVHAAIMLSESMDAAVIADAINLLEQSLTALLADNGPRHQSYAVRAWNELAGAHLRLAMVGPKAEQEERLRRAETYLRLVKESTAKVPREVRSYWMARITEARILRARGSPRDYAGAFEITKEAREKNAGSKFTLIEACIGQGEAALGLGPPNYTVAIEAFEQALRIGGGSRKIAAVCHLHLCRAFLEDNQPSKAREQFALWEPLEPSVENAFIAYLGARMRERLNRTFPPFGISKADLLRRRDADAHLNALRKWLAETAVAHFDGDLGRAAQLLGKGPDALKLWLKWKDESQDAS